MRTSHCTPAAMAVSGLVIGVQGWWWLVSGWFGVAEGAGVESAAALTLVR